MFYDNIRDAYKAGKIEILENGHESVRVVAAGLAGLQSKFLTGAERQSLRDMLNDELLTLLKGTNQKCPECEGTGAIRFLGQEANTVNQHPKLSRQQRPKVPSCSGAFHRLFALLEAE